MTELEMLPSPGHRLVRHAGDSLTFTLRAHNGIWPDGWAARLRTNLGRADRVREEIVHSHFRKLPLAGASWRDLPMRRHGSEWRLTLPAAEVGYFRAKAYALDERGFQHWPGGPDFGVSVHPSWTRTGNTIYCAFPRMFGPNRDRVVTADPEFDRLAAPLDDRGCTVIPPGGKLRDLVRQLPHIFDRLGCRLLHLLPVGPTPTTFARFGRFGSPYAVQDLTAIDPALVEFDRRTTGVQQFEEVTRAVHARGGRVLLDIVINHTGWGSREWNDHPEWFLRDHEGHFESPGAWDVVWEDLVELDQRHVSLWDYLARAFLVWCRRGVDGFRCDAGYKIPMHVWQYITARVRQEFPDTVFLLEGLGGSWEATDALLSDGGMQWAYSELFQNYAGESLLGYLDHSLRASAASGTLVHYSETHDNARLAARGLTQPGPARPEGRLWSRHRNRLCALTSIQGGFGFTSGVEWCATEQVNVHSSRGLAWDNPDNLVDELHALNRLLSDHPCFFDGARVDRLPVTGSGGVALRRESADGLDRCLVLVNPDLDAPADVTLDPATWEDLGRPAFDLTEVYRAADASPAEPVGWERRDPGDGGPVVVRLAPGACVCLSPSPSPRGIAGDAYRRARARADWAVSALATVRPTADVPAEPWQRLADEVDADPEGFLARSFADAGTYPRVVVWAGADTRRVLPVPSDHWLLLRSSVPFRARLAPDGNGRSENRESIPVRDGHVACFPPRTDATTARLHVEEYGAGVTVRTGEIRFLGAEPPTQRRSDLPAAGDTTVLLTNGRGGMARLAVDLGTIHSKYDCLLGANLHPEVPVDRHVFAKRLRAWVNADGFITPLDAGNLVDFEAGPPAHWRFVANAGDGRSVEIHLVADLLEDENTVVLRFSRPDTPPRFGRSLPPECDVRLTLRVDIEDRGFHSETRRNPGADHHFSAHTHPLTFAAPNGGPNGATGGIGFEFIPSPDRRLRVYADSGVFHQQSEWCEGIPHPVEATRGQTASGDAYSPGWFDVPLPRSGTPQLVITAENHPPEPARLERFVAARQESVSRTVRAAGFAETDRFGHALARAAGAYVVRRGRGRTVIAGYPWFLDWGRDTLIAARGLLAAGARDDVRQLLLTFARFEEGGTLPNSIHGEDARNRDTSDAPLWWGVVCEEYAATAGPDWYRTPVGDAAGRTVADVLRDLASGMLAGTPNGIRVDHASGLLWSPSHFTWMDTNHPPGTPREGYPVEIQALWIRLLRHLARIGAPTWDGRGESWSDLARRAEKAFNDYFWLESEGWLADVLVAAPGTPARTAAPSNALRPNQLLAVTLGLVTGERAIRCVEAARRHLVIPGAIRTLAPLPVVPPLPVHGPGGLLNDPDRPYWGRYEGDEDTRRKPAYHNGTAWTWPFPVFCEALLQAHPDDATARAAARSYLASMADLLHAGCLGHLPEILDGDAPHTPRGCDAQAWGVTEALRVWRRMNATAAETAPDPA